MDQQGMQLHAIRHRALLFNTKKHRHDIYANIKLAMAKKESELLYSGVVSATLKPKYRFAELENWCAPMGRACEVMHQFDRVLFCSLSSRKCLSKWSRKPSWYTASCFARAAIVAFTWRICMVLILYLQFQLCNNVTVSSSFKIGLHR